jgi:DNA polymerase-4
MPDNPRAIIHLDLDAFYASVEVLENPELEGKPVVVGGSPEGRGVVAAASYPARAYGVRSAMPTSRALVLCPELIVLRGQHRLYGTYSRRVMDILRQASPLFQQMSVDEAYIDVTDQISTWEGARGVAAQIQRRVRDEVGLSSSLGVATNKLVAKVASDLDKPGGLTVVRPGEEAAFLAPLSVRALWGIGPVTARRLADMNIATVGQLANAPEQELRLKFGKHGPHMARQARGEDRRQVATEHKRKSVGHERTFSSDIAGAAELEQRLKDLSQSVGRRLQESGLAGSTVAIKLRYADFTTLSRQMTLDVPTSDEEIIYQAACTLWQRVWEQGRPVRLLGISVRHLSPAAGQLPLW